MKRKLLTVLISVALIGLILNSSCKTKDVFDITGTWTFTLNYTGWTTFEGLIIFTGTETSGTTATDFSNLNWVPGYGTYTVNDMNVTFNVDWGGWTDTNYTGTASSDNNMSGNFSDLWNYTGTWTVIR